MEVSLSGSVGIKGGSAASSTKQTTETSYLDPTINKADQVTKNQFGHSAGDMDVAHIELTGPIDQAVIEPLNPIDQAKIEPIDEKKSKWQEILSKIAKAAFPALMVVGIVFLVAASCCDPSGIAIVVLFAASGAMMGVGGLGTAIMIDQEMAKQKPKPNPPKPDPAKKTEEEGLKEGATIEEVPPDEGVPPNVRSSIAPVDEDGDLNEMELESFENSSEGEVSESEESSEEEKLESKKKRKAANELIERQANEAERQLEAKKAEQLKARGQ